MGATCQELGAALKSSVARNSCDAILLSGGLDSSILASIARPSCAITCSYGQGAPDLEFAKKVSERFCGSLFVQEINPTDMMGLVETIVKIFKTFDPIEVRNSVVALTGIMKAKEEGYSEIMTGDGADELFAGYRYLSRYYSDLQGLDIELRRLWSVMHFSSIEIGKQLGVKVRTPYLDPEFSVYAKSIPVTEKVGEHTGEKWGKFLLRRCYADSIGGDIAWRPKLAQEQGVGTDRFAGYLNDRIDDLTYSNRTRSAVAEGVALRSKEHLHYYAIFRSYFPPPKEQDCTIRCPSCHACIEQSARFCRTCGEFPVDPVQSP